MRVLTQTELLRATRTELMALLRRIASELPNLPEGPSFAALTRTCKISAGL